MMIDKLLVLSDAQSVTTTAASSDTLDLLGAGDAGQAVWVEFLIDTTFTSNGATIQFEIQTDDDSAFGSTNTLFITGAIGVATLVAGYVPARFRLPTGCQRYLRANYTVASGPAAAGKVDCRLVLNASIPQP